tara:strand:- start:16 stop:504 length:489 start_codon:yes stop_codon:yes gene_type:complete
MTTLNKKIVSTVEENEIENKIKNNFTDLIYNLSNLKSQITVIQNSIRNIEKGVKKELRTLDRKLTKNKTKGSRKPSGFAVPTQISKALCNFMKVEEGVKMARTEVTQYIISYIKKKELQDKQNGRKIKPDMALKSLLKVKKNEDLTYFNLQKYMNKHFVKKA